jgi:hypothetical protein
MVSNPGDGPPCLVPKGSTPTGWSPRRTAPSSPRSRSPMAGKRSMNGPPNGWRKVSSDFAVPHRYNEDVREAPDGSIWVAGFDSLVRWQRRGGEWSEFSDLPVPALVDGSGSTWFAGDDIRHQPTRPVVRLPDGTWRQWNVPTSGLTLSPDGRVWGWHSNRIHQWNGQGSEPFDDRVTGLRTILHILPDRAGTLWAIGLDPSGNPGVAAYDQEAWHPVPWQWPDPSIQILSVHPADAGVWVVLVPPDQSQFLATTSPAKSPRPSRYRRPRPAASDSTCSPANGTPPCGSLATAAFFAAVRRPIPIGKKSPTCRDAWYSPASNAATNSGSAATPPPEAAADWHVGATAPGRRIASKPSST